MRRVNAEKETGMMRTINLTGLVALFFLIVSPAFAGDANFEVTTGAGLVVAGGEKTVANIHLALGFVF